MKTFAKTALLALTLVAGAAGANAKQVELVTAIGFGQSHVQATQEAVRAWIVEASRMYGSADWNTALRTNMECFEQKDAGNGYSTNSIVVGGDVTGKWSCSVTGLPLSALIGN